MTKMTMLIKDVNDIPAKTFEAAPGILFKFLLDKSNSKSMKAGLMSLGPKVQDQPHYHSVEEMILVLRGQAILIDCNGKKYPLKPGSIFVCPPGIGGAHGVENTSDFPTTMLFIYPCQDHETMKYESASGKKHRSEIVVKNIEDIKLDSHSFPDVRIKIICDGSSASNLFAGIMWWNPESKLPPSEHPHYHSVEEFQMVLYGNSTLTDCNGKKYPLSEGVTFLCPAGIGGAHGVENTSDMPMSLLFAYSAQEFESTPYVIP
jgi:quercetin dioxygenase-like cupin family protein